MQKSFRIDTFSIVIMINLYLNNNNKKITFRIFSTLLPPDEDDDDEDDMFSREFALVGV